MAVLIESISVIITRDAIQSRYPGKWQGFVEEFLNPTLCSDGEIVRIGFKTDENARTFVTHLEQRGLIFQHDGKSQDMALVDQSMHPMYPARWLEYGTMKFGKHTVSACWVKGSKSKQVVVPQNWHFEESIGKADLTRSLKELPFAAAIMAALKTPETVGDQSAQSAYDRLENEFLPRALLIADNEGRNIAFSHFTVGIILRLLSRPAEAESRFRRANELQPGVLNILQELVRCLGEQSRDEEALVFARDAVAVASQDAGAWSNLAVALAHCGNHDEARRAIDKAISLNPNDPSIRNIRENFDQYFNPAETRIN